MILYHTSTIEIRNPDVIHSRACLDFDRGFYLTVLRQQAERYGERFKRRGEDAVMNIYEFDDIPRHLTSSVMVLLICTVLAMDTLLMSC